MRKERREPLDALNLNLELRKVIKHFFPDLITLLKQINDHRHQSYIDYQNHVILFTRMRSFEKSRIRNKYWQIIVDGTQLYTFDERHCQHCLTRKFKDDEGNVKRTEYYHVVLEATLGRVL